jgi:hypothetical protein
VFYETPDGCGINALILFINANPLWKNNTMRGFLKHLVLEMMRPHKNEWLTIKNLPRNLMMIMKLCKTEHSPLEDIPAGSKRCNYCSIKNGKRKNHSSTVFHATSQCAQTTSLGCIVLVLRYTVIEQAQISEITFSCAISEGSYITMHHIHILTCIPIARQ